MKNKIAKLLVASLTMTTVFSGTVIVKAEKKESSDPVEITVQSWQYALGDYKGNSSDDKLTQAIADEFNSTHDDIHVTVNILREDDHYNALKVDLAAGSAPDVIGIAPGAKLEEYKSQMVPLVDYVKDAWGDSWEDKFSESAFTTIKLSGDEIYKIVHDVFTCLRVSQK